VKGLFRRCHKINQERRRVDEAFYIQMVALIVIMIREILQPCS
jgi:hypothetical protein